VIRSSLCSHCGAPIPFEGRDVAVCGYCGVENRWAAPPPEVAPGSPVERRNGLGNANFPPTGSLPDVDLREEFLRRKRLAELARTSSSMALGGWVLALLPVVLIAGVSFGIARWNDSKKSNPSRTSPFSSSEDSRYWGGVAPAIVDLDGDAVEDVVGYHWGAGSEVSLGAFDGATLATKWSLGPFGKWEGTPYLHLVVRGARVVAIRDSVARIVDVKAGKLVTELSLSDKVRSICVPEGSANGVWLNVDDGNHVLVDAAVGTAKPEGRPADCAVVGTGAQDKLFLKDAEGFRYSVSGTDLKVPGFSASVFVQDGPYALAVGSKSPGTPFPMLVGGSTTPPPRPNLADERVRRDIERVAKRVGVPPEQMTFGGGSFAVTWQKRLGPDGSESNARQESHPIAAHVPGGLVTVYAVGDVSHLVRVEAATGKVLWDIAVPGKESRFDGLSASASRVYLYGAQFLLVFDAKTGAEAGLVGSRTLLMR